MSVSDRMAAPNRPAGDAATAVWRHRHITPILFTLVLASTLTGLVSTELAGPSATPSAKPSAPHVSTDAGLALNDRPDRGRALPDRLLARPLFAASRRPALVDPAAPTAIAVDNPPHLVGTLMTGRTDRTALLAVTNLPKLQAVHEGDTLGGYRIKAINPGEVLAEGPSGPITLTMDPHRRAAEPVQPVSIEAAHNAIGAPDQDE